MTFISFYDIFTEKFAVIKFSLATERSLVLNFIYKIFDLLEKAIYSIISFDPNIFGNVFNAFKVLAHPANYNAFEVAKAFKNSWGYIVSFLLIFRAVYVVVGIFTTRKFKPAKNQHKYAILIAARNEESVIGNLIKSIKKQDYPSELITTFVVADNCTDSTAEISRNHGAICYERFDDEHRTKGFALQFLFERIEEDYGRDSFEGYFIFDADNLLNTDYVTRMNESFDAGEKIVTSFRNTKNFDDNWISASYALHWIRTSIKMHRARSLFHLATHIQGTGFLFSNELVKNGWKYTSLTEDRAFAADAVAAGYKISYNDAAEFYDEQPVNLKIVLRQRIRWAKGHILAFVESGWQLFKNSFIGIHKEASSVSAKKTFKDWFSLRSLRLRFMSFDMFMLVAPRPLFAWARRIIVGFFYIVTYINQGFFACLYTVIFWRISWRLANHWVAMCEAIFIFLWGNKRIKKFSWIKKLWYSFMWPLFDIIGTVSMYFALFMNVTWKPIPHTSQISIDDTEAIHGSKK